VDFAAVRDIALTLPEVVESTSYRTPAFTVRRKFLARLREENVLVVRIDLADKEYLMQSQPKVYFSTPHYDGYPAVLVRLGVADERELKRLLTAAWRYVAPPRLVAELDATQLSARRSTRRRSASR
jgi:hypothetical protein